MPNLNAKHHFAFSGSSRPVSSAAAALSMLVAASLQWGCVEQGSGVIEQKSKELSAFSAIEVEDGFRTSVAYGERFSVTVWADDNVINDVQVTQTDTTVRLHINGPGVNKATLEAEFTLPLLHAVKASDGSSFEAHNFPLADELNLWAMDGAHIDLSVDAGTTLRSFELHAEDGSHIAFEGNAHDGSVELQDGSNIEMEGTARGLMAKLEDGSSLEAMPFSVEDLLIHMVDGSSASVSASNAVDAYLADGSSLTIYGEATVDAEKHDGASVVRK